MKSRKIMGFFLFCILFISLISGFSSMEFDVEGIIVGSNISTVTSNVFSYNDETPMPIWSNDVTGWSNGYWIVAYIDYPSGTAFYRTSRVGYTWSSPRPIYNYPNASFTSGQITIGCGNVSGNHIVIFAFTDAYQNASYEGQIFARSGIMGDNGVISLSTVVLLKQNIYYPEMGDIVFTTNRAYIQFVAEPVTARHLYVFQVDITPTTHTYSEIFDYNYGSSSDYGAALGGWLTTDPDGIVMVTGFNFPNYLAYWYYEEDHWHGRGEFAHYDRGFPCNRFALTWNPHRNVTLLAYPNEENFGSGTGCYTYEFGEYVWAERNQPFTSGKMQHLAVSYSELYFFVIGIQVQDDQIMLSRYSQTTGNIVSTQVLYDFEYDAWRLNAWKDGMNQDGRVGYTWRKYTNPYDIMFHYFDENGTIGYLDESNPEATDFEITNMEGCGSWVYAGEGKYYEFKLTLEIDEGDPIDAINLRFSDDYHTMEVSYNYTSDEYEVEQGEEYIFLRNGEWERQALTDYYDVTWNILFRESCYDAYDIDVEYMITYDGVEWDWEVIASDYFNIYSQGGLSGFGELAGASGQITGDQQWEIYAGGQYFPSDIFDEHWQTGGINPAVWNQYKWEDENPNNQIGIVDDRAWYSPYPEIYSLRIQGASLQYDPYVEAYYDAGTTGLYYFQVYVRCGDNTTGYSRVSLRAIGRNSTHTWDVDVCVMRFGYAADFDGVYYDDASTTTYSGYDYDVGGYYEVGWHNVTFVVDPSSYTWIPYFDGNSIGNQTFVENYYPNYVDLQSMYGSANRETWFDAIKVWRDFAGGVDGTAWAYTYFRKLQHLHFTLAFGTNDEGIFSLDDPDTNDHNGYIEIGMNVCSRQDTTDWYEQWKVRIQIADGLTNVDNNWVYLNISWFERNNLIKSDFLYAYYEGYGGNRDYFRLFIDLWFSNINSSQTVMGRINSKYYGISNVAPNWLKIITFGYWQTWADMKTEESFTYFQSPLYNTTGSIHPAREIYMMQPWVRVSRYNPSGKYYNFQYYVRNHGLDFNHLPPNQPMEGIDEPPKTDTISLKGEVPNLFWQILGVMQSQLAPLWDALNWGGLNMWDTFVAFLDTVFSFTGNPNVVSDFLAWLSNFWTWFINGVGWIATFATDMFSLFAVTMTTGLDIFGIFITNWISLIQSITSVLGMGLQTGYDLWNDFQMADFIQLFSIMYFAWLVMYGMKEGWDKVATHLTFVFNLIAFAFSLLLSLANFTIRMVSLLIESIPVVE